MHSTAGRWSVILTSFVFVANYCFSQPVNLGITNYKVSIESPYRFTLKKELIISIGSAALIGSGIVLNLSQTQLDSATVVNGNTKNIPSFDLQAVHQFDDRYLVASDVLLFTSMAMPFISFVDKRVSGHAFEIIGLYAETMAVNQGIYQLTTGLITRRRPLTYNIDTNSSGEPIVSLSAKLAKGVSNSFFSGHTSTAAAATFFGARVFTDFRPHSKLVPFVWGAAVAVPGFVAYSRYKAGKHFPSDVATGYIVGAAVGYLIPTIHKSKQAENISLFPIENGLGMVYQF